MFRLPWVSRERFDEVKRDLETRLAAEIAERHTILDFLTRMSLGHPIYAAPEPPKAKASKAPDTRVDTASNEPPVVEDSFSADVKAAKRAGYHSTTDIARWITQNNIARDAEKRRNTPVPDDFEAAIAEGQKAAGKPE